MYQPSFSPSKTCLFHSESNFLPLVKAAIHALSSSVASAVSILYITLLFKSYCVLFPMYLNDGSGTRATGLTVAASFVPQPAENNTLRKCSFSNVTVGFSFQIKSGFFKHFTINFCDKIYSLILRDKKSNLKVC